MIGEKGMKDRLVNEFVENYLEKLFYFCLKRTGGVQEAEDLPEDCTMSHDSTGDEKSMFFRYRLRDNAYRLWKRKSMTYAETLFLGDAIRNGRNRASFSDSEQKMWREIENCFAHTDSGGNIIPDILVLYSDVMEQIEAFWEKHPLYGELMGYFESILQEIIGILKRVANPLLHDQLFYCASERMFSCRMMAIHDLVEEGRLIPPEDPGHSRAGMYIWLRR